jgi:hypothetical protein
MSRRGWKAREREAAALLRGTRYPANTGARIDVESDTVIGQVKARQRCSLAELEALALEMERLGALKFKLGVVLCKRPAGRGNETPWLVVMTAATYEQMSGPLPALPAPEPAPEPPG